MFCGGGAYSYASCAVVSVSPSKIIAYRSQFFASSFMLHSRDGNNVAANSVDGIRVLHLIETSGPGGAENTLLNLVDELSRQQVSSVVVLRKKGWLAERLVERGVPPHIIPFEGLIPLQWLRAMVGLVRSQNITIIHTHEFAMNCAGALVARVCDLPHIATVHGKNYYPERLRRRLAYKWLARGSSMVAVSDDLKCFLIDLLKPKHADRIRSIPNGIPVSRYQATERERDAVRKELGVPQGAPLIGAIGNLYTVKGHRYLVEAIARLSREGSDLYGFIAGRGPCEESLRLQASDLGIADRVSFLGFRSDVPQLLAALDIYAMPSLSEGLPLALLEAMAAGKPVVASRRCISGTVY